MEIKLEITGVKTLTLEQRKAIQQKLVEICGIVNNRDLTSSMKEDENKKQIRRMQENLLEKIQDEVERLTRNYNRIAELSGWKKLNSDKMLDYLLNK